MSFEEVSQGLEPATSQPSSKVPSTDTTMNLLYKHTHAHTHCHMSSDGNKSSALLVSFITVIIRSCLQLTASSDAPTMTAKCTHTHTHKDIHTHTHTHTHKDIHMRAHTHTHTHSVLHKGSGLLVARCSTAQVCILQRSVNMLLSVST